MSSMIEDRLIVMTDERLDWLAERFQALRVREWLHVPFGAYVRDHHHYDALAVMAASVGLVESLYECSQWLNQSIPVLKHALEGALNAMR